MRIDDNWNFKDLVTGLKFSVIVGKKLDRLHIENLEQGKTDNRDFWFTKNGEFDGTGSALPDCENINPNYEQAIADEQVDFSKKT